jgi:hypothetical protein
MLTIFQLVLSKVLYISFIFFLRKKKYVLIFSEHATLRLERRSEEFGIPFEESRKRVSKTIQQQCKVHQRNGKYQCSRYYSDNLSYQVIYHVYNTKIYVITIILKRGRT